MVIFFKSRFFYAHWLRSRLEQHISCCVNCTASPTPTTQLEQTHLNLPKGDYRPDFFCTWCTQKYTRSHHFKPPPPTLVIHGPEGVQQEMGFCNPPTRCSIDLFVRCLLPSSSSSFPYLLPPILPLSVSVSSSASLSYVTTERPTAYWWRGVWALGRQTWEKTSTTPHCWWEYSIAGTGRQS